MLGSDLLEDFRLTLVWNGHGERQVEVWQQRVMQTSVGGAQRANQAQENVLRDGQYERVFARNDETYTGMVA